MATALDYYTHWLDIVDKRIEAKKTDAGYVAALDDVKFKSGKEYEGTGLSKESAIVDYFRAIRGDEITLGDYKGAPKFNTPWYTIRRVIDGP